MIITASVGVDHMKYVLKQDQIAHLVVLSNPELL
jgi:hypothetical protein